MSRTCQMSPNIIKQLAELVTRCRECSMNATNRIEPLVASQLPQYPWQKVATDLFEFNKQNYVLVIDYYSQYIEVARLERTTSTAVINHMKSIFARHGLPDIVISDNGPQYSSAEFESFSREYKFTHVTSNPMHYSGNGEAERAVRTKKSLLRSAKDPYIVMLNYRHTPIADGYSPAELSMARNLRTKVPVMPSTLKIRPPGETQLRSREQTYREKMKQNFDERHAANDLPHFEEGDEMRCGCSTNAGLAA